MNKTILYVIAFVNILISVLTYQQRYVTMIDCDPTSKSMYEIITLISCMLFILSSISLITIIKSISKFKKYIIMSCYLLIGIISLEIQIYLSIIPTGLFSFTVLTISISLITDAKNKNLIILNGLLLVLNTAWGILFYI